MQLIGVVFAEFVFGQTQAVKNSLYFDISNSTYDQITELFDFIWPTAAAMWNLRWQVQGFVAAAPSATNEEVRSRFVLGSDLYGVNLKRACLETTWEGQKAKFAKLLLIDLCAMFESWISQVLNDLGMKTQAKEKGLQFPTGTASDGTPTGVWPTVGSITSPDSPFLTASFYPVLLKHKKNAKLNLDNLLRCYRYFKECRNNLIHNGGIADKKAEDAYNQFKVVANKSDLGLNEVPKHYPLLEGNVIVLDLRGVVGLSDVLLRIIATLDAEIARSKASEDEFKRRWIAANGRGRVLNTTNSSERRRQIKRYVAKADFPKPTAPEVVAAFLRSNTLIG